MTFITETEIDKALDYLRDTAEPAAKARADRIYVEEFAKVVKAQAMQEQSDLSLGAQEREAYASDRYQLHLEAIRQAVEADEKFRFMRKAAEAKIDAWRTMCSNERAHDKVG